MKSCNSSSEIALTRQVHCGQGPSGGASMRSVTSCVSGQWVNDVVRTGCRWGRRAPGYGGKFRGCRKPNAGWPLRGGQPASKRCELSSRCGRHGVNDLLELALDCGAQGGHHGDEDGRDQGDEQAVLNGGGALGALAEALLRDEDERGEVSGNGIHVGSPFSTVTRPERLVMSPGSSEGPPVITGPARLRRRVP